MKRLSHRQWNHLLTIVVVGLASYILLTPLLPTLRTPNGVAPVPYDGELSKILEKTSPTTENKLSDTPKRTPQGNRLVIPSAHIDISLSVGSDTDSIKQGGALLKPMHTSSPFQEGNSIVVAHRFTYGDPTGGFYFLPRVKAGDLLAIYWEGKEVIYKVKQTKIVTPEDSYVENNTSSRTLTLYTCTPLYVFDHRFVVLAEPL